jgi:hypothetical protein
MKYVLQISGFLLQNLDKDWNWQELSRNPNITPLIIHQI